MDPGEVYEFTIDMWQTSQVFKAGHRILVEVSSSNFPRFDRNTNMGGQLWRETELQTASQTVYHDRKRPSHVVLPVIPAVGRRGRFSWWWCRVRGGGRRCHRGSCRCRRL